VARWVLEALRSSYYEWLGRPPSERDWYDAHLLDEICVEKNALVGHDVFDGRWPLSARRDEGWGGGPQR
jgi:hypothetical protein